MKLTTRIKLGAAALIALLLIGGIVIGWQINTVRMGGAMQLREQQVSDLIADILPPPEYVIEPYLEASLLVIDPSRAAEGEKRLAQLRGAYDDRHAYWAKSDLPPALKQQIAVATDSAAKKFWDALDSRLLPALKSGDQTAVQAAYAEVSASYNEHRQAVDKLVADAAVYNTRVRGEADRTVRTMIGTLSCLAMLVIAFVGAGVFYLLRQVINPMVSLALVTTQLADGESPEIPSRERTDALGLLAKALQSFRDAAEQRLIEDRKRLEDQTLVNDTLGERLEALRDGDLTKTINIAFPAGYEGLRTNFNEAVSALRRMVQMVSESASSIDSGAHEIASAADDLARRTEASAANLEETNAGLQQVEERVRGGRGAALATKARADQAIQAVGEGRATGADAAASMDRVAASAENIGTVIDGLDKIAFQTRVLAMNAAVEAGRAGAAGSGFAVVADLVSALAQRAEEEAKRVRTLITDTRVDIDAAVDSVRRMDRSLATIAGDVDALHTLLTRLESDSDEQVRAMTEIAGAMAQLDMTTQQNAAMVEQTSAAARNLSSEVTVLATHAAAFKFERREHDVPVAFDRRGSRRDGGGADRRAARPGGARAAEAPAASVSIH